MLLLMMSEGESKSCTFPVESAWACWGEDWNVKCAWSIKSKFNWNKNGIVDPTITDAALVSIELDSTLRVLLAEIEVSHLIILLNCDCLKQLDLTRTAIRQSNLMKWNVAIISLAKLVQVCGNSDHLLHEKFPPDVICGMAFLHTSPWKKFRRWMNHIDHVTVHYKPTVKVNALVRTRNGLITTCIKLFGSLKVIAMHFHFMNDNSSNIISNV